MTHMYDWIIALAEATLVSEKPTVIKCTCAKSYVSPPTPRAASGCLWPLGAIVGQEANGWITSENRKDSNNSFVEGIWLAEDTSS
ncbi:hypothetical protein AV530_000287 [Patagioenas fasciata monilis]|uniref:Uncharacterized protein n=1 Tax=Patagioenas fasciata monilis TaxID=372326 RepID=A0A1V4KDA1_PATFA|nr:hypothetical protein AV530_000287 [Patagioenas fasciata monilis]